MNGCKNTVVSRVVLDVCCRFVVQCVPSPQELRNTVEDCDISQVAVEFHGTAGLQVGYAAHTRVVHNALSALPFSGISVGWGWATQPVSYAAHNVVHGNRVDDFKTVMGDGGGIYVLGPQPNSSMTENWLLNMASARGGGAYYPDEGSAYWELSRNVFSNASHCADNCEVRGANPRSTVRGDGTLTVCTS